MNAWPTLVAVDPRGYNGALKWIDRERKHSETWLRGFREPSGVALTESHAYVADTNQHRIAVVDRRTESSTSFGCHADDGVVPSEVAGPSEVEGRDLLFVRWNDEKLARGRPTHSVQDDA